MAILSDVATTMQAAAEATGNGTPLVMDGCQDAVVQISGTFVGTVTWEATVDGSNWVGVALADLNSTTRARALTATAPGLFLFDNVGGAAQLRARISAYTSGTITATGRAGR